MSLHSGSALLAGSVFLRDLRLGRIEDVLLDAVGRRVLGLVVLCGDATHRMLPLAAAELADGCARVASALVLMEEGFYRDRCRFLTALRDAPVRRDGETLGTLTDVLFDDEGRVRLLGVEGLGEVPASESIAIDPEARTSAV